MLQTNEFVSCVHKMLLIYIIDDCTQKIVSICLAHETMMENTRPIFKVLW